MSYLLTDFPPEVYLLLGEVFLHRELHADVKVVLLLGDQRLPSRRNVSVVRVPGLGEVRPQLRHRPDHLVLFAALPGDVGHRGYAEEVPQFVAVADSCGREIKPLQIFVSGGGGGKALYSVKGKL